MSDELIDRVRAVFADGTCINMEQIVMRVFHESGSVWYQRIRPYVKQLEAAGEIELAYMDWGSRFYRKKMVNPVRNVQYNVFERPALQPRRSRIVLRSEIKGENHA